MEESIYITLDYKFDNIDDFFNLEFKLYNLHEFKDINIKIKLEHLIQIFTNFKYECYVNNHLIDKIKYSGGELYIFVYINGYNNIKSNVKNTIINISDYFVEQRNYLNDLKKKIEIYKVFIW